MKALSRVATLAVTAVATSAAVATVALAAAGSASVADEPPPLEETFDYPGAKAIEDQHKIKLFKGDGRILFVTSHTQDTGQQCAPGQIQVEKRLAEAPYGVSFCFKTTGKKGWLALEVPANSGIRGGTTPIVAIAKEPGGPDEKFDNPAGQYRPIDPGDGNKLGTKVLVKLQFG
jgi:hypothetical protein